MEMCPHRYFARARAILKYIDSLIDTYSKGKKKKFVNFTKKVPLGIPFVHVAYSISVNLSFKFVAKDDNFPFLQRS